MNDACLDVRCFEVVVLASLATINLMLHSVGVRSCDVVDVGGTNDRSALRPLLLKFKTAEALNAARTDLDRRRVQVLSA